MKTTPETRTRDMQSFAAAHKVESAHTDGPTARIRLTRHGFKKSREWAKAVTAFDASKIYGYAIQGEWLDLGAETELPAGSIVYHHLDGAARLYRVTGDPQSGSLNRGLTIILDWADQRREWPTIRDAVQSALRGGDTGPAREAALRQIAELANRYGITMGEIAGAIG
jgi:hypothetical protein